MFANPNFVLTKLIIPAPLKHNVKDEFSDISILQAIIKYSQYIGINQAR